jgi:hypothetical protein
MVQEVPDGGRKPRVTDEEILDVLRDHPDPVLSTAEVADELTIKRRGTLNRLRELEEEGAVVSKQIGGRNTVWWLTPEPDRASPLADPGPENDIAASNLSESTDGAGERSEPADGESMAGVEAPSSGAHPGGNAPGTGLQEPGSVGSDVDAVVEAVSASWDDAPDRLEARTAAAKAVLQHALDTGDHIGKADAIDRFHEEYPVPDQNPETWWRKNARDVLQEVGEYSRGRHGYRVTADALEDFLRDEGER